MVIVLLGYQTFLVTYYLYIYFIKGLGKTVPMYYSTSQTEVLVDHRESTLSLYSPKLLRFPWPLVNIIYSKFMTNGRNEYSRIRYIDGC